MVREIVVDTTYTNPIIMTVANIMNVAAISQPIKPSRKSPYLSKSFRYKKINKKILVKIITSEAMI